MKITIEGQGELAQAWFEGRELCELRVHLTPGLQLAPLAQLLKRAGWRIHEGEQVELLDDTARRSVLFSREWNGTTQPRTRSRTSLIFTEAISQQITALELKRETRARRAGSRLREPANHEMQFT